MDELKQSYKRDLIRSSNYSFGFLAFLFTENLHLYLSDSPLLSLEKQREIVGRVKSLFSLVDSIEARCSKALESVEKIE